MAKFKINDKFKSITGESYYMIGVFTTYGHYGSSDTTRYKLSNGYGNILDLEESELTLRIQCNLLEYLPILAVQTIIDRPLVGQIDHVTHEVITNIVLNKTFKYCRDCKSEVFGM